LTIKTYATSLLLLHPVLPAIITNVTSSSAHSSKGQTKSEETKFKFLEKKTKKLTAVIGTDAFIIADLKSVEDAGDVIMMLPA